jgi:hypothetical protein
MPVTPPNNIPLRDVETVNEKEPLTSQLTMAALLIAAMPPVQLYNSPPMSAETAQSDIIPLFKTATPPTK